MGMDLISVAVFLCIRTQVSHPYSTAESFELEFAAVRVQIALMRYVGHRVCMFAW